MQVDPALLREKQANFQKYGGQIEECISNLAADISVLQDSWTGSKASISFNDLMNEWNTSVRNLNDVLSRVATYLGQAATAYETTDQDLVVK